MWTPLAIPRAATEVLLELPRLVTSAARAASALERLVEIGEELEHKADLMLVTLERAQGLGDTIVTSGDKLIMSGDKLLEAAQSMESLAGRLMESGDKLVDASSDVQRLAQPFLHATDSAQRIVSRLQRDPGTDRPSGEDSPA